MKHIVNTPKISLIAAMAHDRVIGANNQLLWHLPSDFKHFKSVTMGKPVIMGRKTFESIGRALPGRLNIIITRNSHYQSDDCVVVHSLAEALAEVSHVTEVMIIGGAEIYSAAMDEADMLYLTYVDAQFEGDTYFPEWDPREWQEVSREAHPPDVKNPYPYTFVTLMRI